MVVLSRRQKIVNDMESVNGENVHHAQLALEPPWYRCQCICIWWNAWATVKKQLDEITLHTWMNNRILMIHQNAFPRLYYVLYHSMAIEAELGSAHSLLRWAQFHHLLMYPSEKRFSLSELIYTWMSQKSIWIIYDDKVTFLESLFLYKYWHRHNILNKRFGRSNHNTLQTFWASNRDTNTTPQAILECIRLVSNTQSFSYKMTWETLFKKFTPSAPLAAEKTEYSSRTKKKLNKHSPLHYLL